MNFPLWGVRRLGARAGVYLFFEECYFRIRVRVSVNCNNILLKKIDPGPRACVYTDTPTYACRVTKLSFFEEN